MEKKYFIINTGSTSKKLALYHHEMEVCSVHLETEGQHYVSTIVLGGNSSQKNITAEQYEKCLEYMLDLLIEEKIIIEKKEIDVIVVRVVAPGVYFQEHKLIDDEYIQKLTEAQEITPLHVVPVLEMITYVDTLFPRVPIVGISDTAFHKDMPMEVKRYGISEEFTEKFGIHKYGYHGISASSLVRKIEKMFGSVPEKIVLCHLGGGVSITSVRDKKGIDTSMGFTPVSGAVMSTRVGDIDPVAVLYMLKKSGKTVEDLEKYFNQDCGLKAISGKSDDMREIIRLREAGDARAQLALDVFQNRIKKEIGSAFAVQNGIDMLVFSGTIGERSSIVRGIICNNLEQLGIILDPDQNEKIVSVDAEISSQDSPVKVLVMKTEEMLQMAIEAKQFLE